MGQPRKPRKLLIASIGVATVNFVAACGDRQNGHNVGNLMAPTTIGPPTTGTPPVSGNLVPPLAGGGSGSGGTAGSGGTLTGSAGEAGESGDGGVPSSAGKR
jgi:hypothetical protein